MYSCINFINIIILEENIEEFDDDDDNNETPVPME